MEDLERREKINSLASEVIKLSRNTLMVNLRFLDAALSQFEYMTLPVGTFSTDGKKFIYNPEYVLKSYSEEREAPVRDYLHMVMHCIFRHMYCSPDVDRRIWNTACDIAVESAISELGIKCTETRKEAEEQRVISGIRKELKQLTAEKVYHYLKEKGLEGPKLAEIESVFASDSHDMWYIPPEETDGDEDNGEKGSENGENGSGGGLPESSEENENTKGKGNSQKEKGENGKDSENKDGRDRKDNINSTSGLTEKQSRVWKDISERIQMELETFSREHGDWAGSMVQNLREVNREKYDYAAFLKKFAVKTEVMKINDDEFDYVFYTYGLKLYGKMPLVEPLEYKDEKRIRDFVIAIDTSGSTSGDLVQKFVIKTYNILKSTETFATRINLHILQCDAEIQEDVRITCREEFEEYVRTMKIRGLGGTDFRPVFKRVDEMIARHEFSNFRGLIYFTDGYGKFPESKPSYETAFVFVDDEYNNIKVPSWAIRLILGKEEI